MFVVYILFFFYRQQIFEQERIKLLKKHADELIGFLPPGLLREFQGLRLK